MNRLRKSFSFFTANNKTEENNTQIDDNQDYLSIQKQSSGIFKNIFRTTSTPNVLTSFQQCNSVYSSSFNDSEISDFPMENEELFSSSDSSSEDEQFDEGLVNAVFEYDDGPFPEIYTRYGEPGKGKYELGDATDIKYVGNGKYQVTDMINSRVSTFSKRGKHRIRLCNDKLKEPCVSAISNEGKIVVTSRKTKSVSVFSPNGEFEFSFGENLFQRPYGLDVDKLGRIIVSDILSNEVSVHDELGSWLFNVGDSCSPVQQFNCPRYVHATETNNIIVADSSNHCIKIFSESGRFIRKVGSFGREDGKFKSPYAITSDKQGNILVSDHYNDRICFFTKDGEFIRHLVTSADGLYHPQGIALSPDNKLYVTHGKMKATEVIAFSFKRQSFSESTEVTIEESDTVFKL